MLGALLISQGCGRYSRARCVPSLVSSASGLAVARIRPATVRRPSVLTAVAFLETLDAQVKTSAPWRTPEVADTFTAALAEHRAVTEAIRARDTEAARIAMLAHHGHDRDRRIRQRVRVDQTSPSTTAPDGTANTQP